MKKQKKKSHPGFHYIQTSGGIEEYTLKQNGLRVLFLADNSAPVVGFMVTYHVGSRNEATGHTGATHLLEHLMFKGSKKFNKKKGNDISKILEERGAKMNATTWLDRTNYYAVIGRAHLESVIAAEADRMRNATFEEKDLNSEMTVVRNEFEQGENDPWEVLDKSMWATAYQAHPYHHPTIGWRADIENISIKRLRKFYNTFYWPNNATATVVGDVDRKTALFLIKKYFSVFHTSPELIPEVYTQEPKQEGPRRITVTRRGTTNIVGLAHKIPPGLHKDTHALQILSTILGSGKNSRLYKTLVDTGLASSVEIMNVPFRDSSLFIVYVFLTPRTSHEAVEKIILKEYTFIQKNIIPQKEINVAKAKAASFTAFSRDGVSAVISTLNEAIAVGDWTFYTTFEKKVSIVKTKDIREIARKYLISEQSTTGFFVGKEN